MSVLLTTLLVMVLAGALTVFAYLDRIYRELGRVTTGRMHAHLDVFEAEIEPRLRMGRRGGGLAFSLLARLWLAAVVSSFRAWPMPRPSSSRLLLWKCYFACTLSRTCCSHAQAAAG